MKLIIFIREKLSFLHYLWIILLIVNINIILQRFKLHQRGAYSSKDVLFTPYKCQVLTSDQHKYEINHGDYIGENNTRVEIIIGDFLHIL